MLGRSLRQILRLRSNLLFYSNSKGLLSPKTALFSPEGLDFFFWYCESISGPCTGWEGIVPPSYISPASMFLSFRKQNNSQDSVLRGINGNPDSLWGNAFPKCQTDPQSEPQPHAQLHLLPESAPAQRSAHLEVPPCLNPNNMSSPALIICSLHACQCQHGMSEPKRPRVQRPNSPPIPGSTGGRDLPGVPCRGSWTPVHHLAITVLPSCSRAWPGLQAEISDCSTMSPCFVSKHQPIL